MKGFGLFILTQIVLLNLVYSENFFKVPLEIREKNRPERLIDNANDPDLQRLKQLQDKFFTIVGNSSLGKEFKSFNQLFQLVDSDAGMEIGKLLLNGIMIGFGKENSNQLLTEFFDDFQYKLSPDFADAIKDYKDFMRSVDLSLIPQTIEMLFRKDNLGNSLASMPLGQLIDIIQPETLKYGIDARALLNGIVGRGGSQFPDLLMKMVKSFNVSNIVQTIAQTAVEDIEQPTKKSDGQISRKSSKDPTLMLFKPYIAKLLKDNGIDLDTDAVIQVLTPFFGGLTKYVETAMKSNGKDFNVAQLLPMLGLLSSQFSGNKNSKSPDLLGTAMSMLGNLEGNNDISNILNIASQFLGNGGKKKEKRANKQEDENPGLESVLGGLGSLLNSDASGIDVKQMIDLAANMLGSIAKPPAQENKKDVKHSKHKNNFPNVLGQFLLKIESDKKSQTKVKDAFSLVKTLIYEKLPSMQELKEQISVLLKTFNSDTDQNIDNLTVALQFTKEEWLEFLSQLQDENFRTVLVGSSVSHATDLVTFVASDLFQQQQNIMLKQKLNEGLSAFGISGVTLKNFPDKLGPVLKIMSRGWNVPGDISSLLVPLKITLTETWEWYRNNMNILKGMQREEVEQLVATSLENDLALGVLAIASVSDEVARGSAACLPRAVCHAVSRVGEDEHLRRIVTQLASIFYGGFEANRSDDFMLVTRSTRASLFQGECKQYFPISCNAEDKPQHETPKHHEEL